MGLMAATRMARVAQLVVVVGGGGSDGSSDSGGGSDGGGGGSVAPGTTVRCRPMNNRKGERHDYDFLWCHARR